jgi:hypothetical protein
MVDTSAIRSKSNRFINGDEVSWFFHAVLTPDPRERGQTCRAEWPQSSQTLTMGRRSLRRPRLIPAALNPALTTAVIRNLRLYIRCWNQTHTVKDGTR